MAAKGTQRGTQSKSIEELKDELRRKDQENEGLRLENQDLKTKTALFDDENDDDEGDETASTRLIRPEIEPLDEYEAGIHRENIISKINSKNLSMGTDEIRAHISCYDPKTKKNESLGYEDIYGDEDIPDENSIGEKYGCGKFTVVIRDKMGIVTKYVLNLSEKRFPKKTGSIETSGIKLPGTNDPLIMMLQLSAEKAEAAAAEARKENRELMMKFVELSNKPPQNSFLNDPSVIMKLIDVSSKNQPDLTALTMKMFEKGMDFKERLNNTDDDKGFIDTIKGLFVDVAKSAVPKGKELLSALSSIQAANAAGAGSAPVELKPLPENDPAKLEAHNPEKIALTPDQLRVMNENLMTLSFFDELSDIFNGTDEEDHNDILDDAVEKIIKKPLYIHISRHILLHKENYIEILKSAIPEIKVLFDDESFKNYVILLIRKVIEASLPKADDTQTISGAPAPAIPVPTSPAAPEAIKDPKPPEGTEDKK